MTTAAEKKSILDSKIGVNSLTDSQLNDMINYCLHNYIKSKDMKNRKMLQRVGGPDIFPHGQVVYFTNFMSSPYPRFHVPKKLWDSWATKPLKRDFLFHLFFWRWINGGKLCNLDPDIHISHLICYRGPDPKLKSENFLLLREESKKINESRKGCWDNEDPVNLDFLGKGICPHKPGKCQLVDWDVMVEYKQ
jgi:hypothetical protein